MNRKRKIILCMLLFVVLVSLITIITGRIEARTDKKAELLPEMQSEEDFSEYREVYYLELNDEIYSYTGRIENYLFIGTDRSGAEEKSGEEYRGSMADFLALLVLNCTQKKYTVIQLNRDTMTDIILMDREGTETGSRLMQLCTAHWYGGDREQSCENTVDAVSNLLGELDIDGYYALPMDYIAQLNHAVGGVTLTVQEDFSKLDSGMKEGETIKLTDEQAFVYISERMNIGDGENLSRMSRQKQFLEAFISQARTKLNKDAGFAMDTVNELNSYATTDINRNQMTKIINRLSKYDSGGIIQLEGNSAIGQKLDDGIDHTEYYLNQHALLNMMTGLYGLVKE